MGGASAYENADRIYLPFGTCCRAGQMVQLTAEPPLETICPEIVNMVLESVEVYDGGILHFHFLDGTELEIETEE